MFAVRTGTRVPSGVDQQHQAEQPGDLPLGGQQPAQDPAQPDGFVGQVDPLQIGPSWRRTPP